MGYLLLTILALLIMAVIAIPILMWHRWTFFLHIYDNKFLLELRGFGIRRRLIYRDFSQKPAEPAKVQQKPRKSKKEKGHSLKDRWASEKKRIYDPENGGYQSGGLSTVLDEYRGTFGQFWDILRKFSGDIKHRIHITSLWIRLDYGTGDPANTGMLYGSIWGAIGVIYPLALRYVQMVYPVMEITPDFYGKRFDLEVKSIIKVRPAHIINALIKQGLGLAITYCYKHFTKGSVKND